MSLPTCNETTRRLNPQIFGTAERAQKIIQDTVAPRMKQNRGPKLNKTESAFQDHLRATFDGSQIEREGVTLLLANGVRYTADFADFNFEGRLTLWEVKGEHAWDDAIVKLKVAAARYPRITFYLASFKRKTGLWRIELVFP